MGAHRDNPRKPRAIAFSPDMIRALQEGRKTQTRRAIGNNQLRALPTPDFPKGFALAGELLEKALIDADGFRHIDGDIWTWQANAFEYQTGPRTTWICHIGAQAGDINYVTEAWRTLAQHDSLSPNQLPAWSPIAYEADASAEGREPDCWPWGRYRHARFMPRHLSRFTLEVTAVRLQALLDITNEDAEAEGFAPGPYGEPHPPTDIGDGLMAEIPWGYASAGGHFQIYWKQLHPDWDGYSSPPVIARSFTLHRRNVVDMFGAGA